MGASRDIERGTRNPAADRHAAIHGCHQIGGTETEQLAIGVHALTPLDRQGLCHRNVLHHPDQGHQRRGHGQQGNLGSVGNEPLKVWQPGADLADDGNPLPFQIENDDGGRRRSHDEQRHQADNEGRPGTGKAGAYQQARQSAAGKRKNGQ